MERLVEFEAPVGFFKFIELEEHLSEKLGAKVDLVTPDALKPLIKPQVMGGGCLCLKREISSINCGRTIDILLANLRSSAVCYIFYNLTSSFDIFFTTLLL